MSNGKLDKEGCGYGRMNRYMINEIQKTGEIILKLVVGSIFAPIVVGIVLYVILRK